MKYDINGISVPFGGISWSKSNSPKEAFSYLFLFLESKRILVNPIDMEFKEWCIESVLEIKETLVTITKDIKFKNDEISIIRDLIDTCNTYLDTVSPMNFNGIIYKNGDRWEDLSFDNAMKKFRASFKTQIIKIEQKYKLKFNKDIPDIY